MRRTVGRFRKSDYIYGVEKEEEVRNILQTYFVLLELYFVQNH